MAAAAVAAVPTAHPANRLLHTRQPSALLPPYHQAQTPTPELHSIGSVRLSKQLALVCCAAFCGGAVSRL